MAKAMEVAKCLLRLAECEDEPDRLSHLRLQKLLYYVQGWSLALRKKPMFPERIEAWAHGPVVRDLYRVFKPYEDSVIPLSKFDDPPKLTKEEAEFTASVWNTHKGYSASYLRALTHKEDPWLEARGNLDPAAACNNEITHDSMRRFFSRRAAQ